MSNLSHIIHISLMFFKAMAFILLSSYSHAITFKPDMYSEFAEVPSRILLDQGNRCLKEPSAIDSAALYFSAIAYRYYGQEEEKENLNTTARALNNLGYIHTFYYLDFKKANIYLNEALGIAKEAEDLNLIPIIYWNLAGIYELNDAFYQTGTVTDKTLSYYEKALDGARQIADWRIYMEIFNNLLNHAISFNNIGLIKEKIDTFRSLPIPMSDPMFEYTVLHCTAVESTLKGKHDDALDAFSCLEEQSKALENGVRFQMMALDSKSYGQMASSDLAGAIHTIEQAVELAKHSGHRDALVNFYCNLSKCYTKLGNDREADKYKILYLVQKDSIFNEYGMKSVSSENFRKDMELMESQVREMTFKHKIQKMTIWMLVIVLSSVAVVLISLIVNYRKVKEKNRRLYQSYKDQMALEEEITTITSNINIEPCAISVPDYCEAVSEDRIDMEEKNIEPESSGKDMAKPVSVSSGLPDRISLEYADIVMGKVRDIMRNNEEVYLPDFSLSRLSELTGCPRQYLSQILNAHEGRNFYSLLAEYRIKRACRIFDDPAMSGQYTIETIASMVGFKSRSNFTVCFKKSVGLTPNQYQRLSHDSRRHISEDKSHRSNMQ